MQGISWPVEKQLHKQDCSKQIRVGKICLNTIKYSDCFNCLNSTNECFMGAIMLHVYWSYKHTMQFNTTLSFAGSHVNKWSVMKSTSITQKNSITLVHQYTSKDKKQDRIIKIESNNYEDVWRRAMNMKLQTQRAGGSSQCTFTNNPKHKNDIVHCLYLLKYAIIRSLENWTKSIT
jgi:hypothetical protein